MESVEHPNEDNDHDEAEPSRDTKMKRRLPQLLHILVWTLVAVCETQAFWIQRIASSLPRGTLPPRPAVSDLEQRRKQQAVQPSGTSDSNNTTSARRGTSKRVAFPFFRVHWTLQKAVRRSAKEDKTNGADVSPNNRTAATASSLRPPSKQQDAPSSTASSLANNVPTPPSGNYTNVTLTDQDEAVVTLAPSSSISNNNTGNSNTTTSSSNTSRPFLTPVPVAETLWRNIYDKAAAEVPVSIRSVEEAWKNKTLFSMPPPPPPAPPTNRSMAATDATEALRLSDLTVQDLERILLETGFVRRSDAAAATASGSGSADRAIEGLGKPVSKRFRLPPKVAEVVPSSSSAVAFPQPSVLSYKSLKWGVTVSAGLSGFVLAISILPSLWLMGGLVGSLYGYQTGTKLADEGSLPTSFLPNLLVRAGRRLAKSYLEVYDMCTAMFFMYKTGQLSYDMWKRYAEVDQRFRIQDKIDAWNTVFVEGKVNFDKWEKENEVGRKVLATLRTAWLVEERSQKKKGLRKERSRYRAIQLIYDGVYFMGRFITSIWRWLSGGKSSELTELLHGVRSDISQARVEEIGSRVGAIVAALVAVNITGALFTISSGFLALLAIAGGLVWPTWFGELLERCRGLLEETRARGRGEDRSTPSPKSSNTSSSGRKRVDRSRYHYYLTNNGKKRYYRVAQAPAFRKRSDDGKPGFLWPWQKPEEPKRPSLFDFR
jgi:hypothetical protein